jgi:hypothetical protein
VLPFFYKGKSLFCWLLYSLIFGFCRVALFWGCGLPGRAPTFVPSPSSSLLTMGFKTLPINASQAAFINKEVLSKVFAILWSTDLICVLI